MNSVRRVLFIAPGKLAAVNSTGEIAQKLRTNASLPAMTILGSLRQLGIEVFFMDSSADDVHVKQVSDHAVRYSAPLAAVLQRVADCQADCVLITSMFSFEQCMVDELCSAIRDAFPRMPIVVGGGHATIRPDWILANGNVSVVIRGDGEDAVRTVVAAINSGADCPRVVGECSRYRDQFTWGTAPARIKNLDRPWEYETVLFRPDGSYRYLDFFTRKCEVYAERNSTLETRSYPLYGSRGCPMRCSYCASSTRDGVAIRHVGSNRLTAELDRGLLAEASNFYNQSDTFGLHGEDRVFLQNVATRRASGSYVTLNNPNAFFTRIFFQAKNNYHLDTGFIDLLAAAGFNVITLAIETFTQRFNRKIDFRMVSISKIRELCSYAKSRGLAIDLYMMYGFPGQDQSELWSDLDGASSLADVVDFVSWHNLTLFPGNEYYEMAVANRLIDETQYRRIVAEGYSFFHPRDEFNFTHIPTSTLRNLFEHSPAWPAIRRDTVQLCSNEQRVATSWSTNPA